MARSATLVEAARHNAKQTMGQKMAETASQEKLLAALAEVFGLERKLRRVEVYDNSHIMGQNAVGGMVVAGAAGFMKMHYRTFNIKGEDITPGDDFGMMREVLRRRFTRLGKEAPQSSPAQRGRGTMRSMVEGAAAASIDEDILESTPAPDAAVPRQPPPPPSAVPLPRLAGEDVASSHSSYAGITGPGDLDEGAPRRRGTPRPPSAPCPTRNPTAKPSRRARTSSSSTAASASTMRRARSSTRLGVTDVAVAAIAKGRDRDAGREMFFVAGREPFRLPPRDPALFFVQRLRDEAHRFAIGTHRARRKKDFTKSPLDEIAGIGPARKRALLAAFGTAKALSRATLGDLEKVPSINAGTAKLVYAYFHERGG